MKTIERAAKAEIKAMPAEVAGSTLAVAMINLARRMDGEPPDREAAVVARELRIGLAELRRLAAAYEREEGLDVSDAALRD